MFFSLTHGCGEAIMGVVQFFTSFGAAAPFWMYTWEPCLTDLSKIIVRTAGWFGSLTPSNVGTLLEVMLTTCPWHGLPPQKVAGPVDSTSVIDCGSAVAAAGMLSVLTVLSAGVAPVPVSVLMVQGVATLQNPDAVSGVVLDVIAVVCMEELFPGVVSAGEAIVAVLESVPVAPGLTVPVTKNLAVAPLFRLTVVLIVPLPEPAAQLPVPVGIEQVQLTALS